MAKNKSGQTAFGASMARLIEQYQPENTRLFDDSMIRHLLPVYIVILMKSKYFRNLMIHMYDNKTKGIFGGFICRTKYIDDKMEENMNDIDQILILGSGMDTRAYRINGLSTKKIFEIDLEHIQMFKKEKIKKFFGNIPENVTFIAIDFNKDDLYELLRKNNFDFTKKSFLIWEGVTQYLEREAVEKVFEFTSKLISDSILVFTYILEKVINKKSNIPGANNWVESFSKNGISLEFGINPENIEKIMGKYRLKVLEDVGTDYYKKTYLEPVGRVLEVSEIERTVVIAK